MFPPTQQLSYDNPLVGFVQKSGSNWGMNYVLADGASSALPFKIAPESDFSEVRLEPADVFVHIVKIWGHKEDHTLSGIKFYDLGGKAILTAGWCPDNEVPGITTRAVVLEEGERLLGIKTKMERDTN